MEFREDSVTPNTYADIVPSEGTLFVMIRGIGINAGFIHVSNDAAGTVVHFDPDAAYATGEEIQQVAEFIRSRLRCGGRGEKQIGTDHIVGHHSQRLSRRPGGTMTLDRLAERIKELQDEGHGDKEAFIPVSGGIYRQAQARKMRRGRHPPTCSDDRCFEDSRAVLGAYFASGVVWITMEKARGGRKEMTTSFTINFKCPKCGGVRIKEIVESDWTESLLDNSGRLSEGIPEFGYQSARGGGDCSGIEYQCALCGKQIVEDSELLIAWLRDNGMIDEK